MSAPRYYLLARDPHKRLPRTINRLRGENVHLTRPPAWRCVFVGDEGEAMTRMLASDPLIETQVVAENALPAGVSHRFEREAKDATTAAP